MGFGHSPGIEHQHGYGHRRIKNKDSQLEAVNKPLLERLNPDALEVVIQRVAAAEMDEMWSYVGKKKEPRWLWHAIDHQTGKVLA